MRSLRWLVRSFVLPGTAGRPSPKKSFLFGHLFLNITNVFCAKKRVGHAGIWYMPQDGHCLASYEVIPHPPKMLVFPRLEKWKYPTENGMRTPTFEKKISDPTFSSSSLAVFVGDILSRRCRLSRTASDPAQKSEKNRPKFQIAFFLFFRRKNWHDFVTPFSTFANIKGSLPTKSTTPNRLR